MANAMYPFICIQKKTSSTVNISGFIHVIIPSPFGDENPKVTECAILGRKAKHINAKSHREENTKGRRPMSVLRAMKMKNAAIKIKMSGMATLSRTVEFIVVYLFCCVKDQARLFAVARIRLVEVVLCYIPNLIIIIVFFIALIPWIRIRPNLPAFEGFRFVGNERIRRRRSGSILPRR